MMFIFQMKFEAAERNVSLFSKIIDTISSQYSKMGKTLGDFYRKSYEFNSELMGYMEETHHTKFVPNYKRIYLSENTPKEVQDRAAFFYGALSQGQDAEKLRANMRNGIELMVKAEVFVKETCNYDVRAELKGGAKFSEVLGKSVKFLADHGIKLDMKALASADSPEEFLGLMKKFQDNASDKLGSVRIDQTEVEERLNSRLVSMSLNLAVMTVNLVEQPKEISFNSVTGKLVIKMTDADEITSTQMMYDAFQVYSMIRKQEARRSEPEELGAAGTLREAARSHNRILFSGSDYAYDAVAGKGAAKEIETFSKSLERSYAEYVSTNPSIILAASYSPPATVQNPFIQQISLEQSRAGTEDAKKKDMKISRKHRSLPTAEDSDNLS